MGDEMVKNSSIINFIKKIQTDQPSLKEEDNFQDDLNNLIHFKKEADIVKLLEESKKELDLAEQLMLEKIIQTFSAKIIVTQSKKYYTYSLKFIPISVLHEIEPENYSEVINKKYDLNPVFKKYKFLHRHSEIVMMNKFVSQTQLEQISYSQVSNYLKDFIDSQALNLDVTFKIPFKHEYGSLLYIPLIFIEPLNVHPFDNIVMNVDSNKIQLALDEMADKMSDDQNMKMYPYPIYDPYECLEVSLSNIFLDMSIASLNDVLNVPYIKVANLSIIKDRNKLIFNASDDKGEEIMHCSLEFPVNSICVSTMEQLKFYFIEEYIGKVIEDKPEAITMRYIGHLH